MKKVYKIKQAFYGIIKLKNVVIKVMIRYEDGKWINSIGVYFFILEDINNKLQNLIKNKFDNVEEVEILFFDIAVNLNRIIPMKYKKISYNDGILKLSKYLDFLKEDYNKLYETFSEELITINDVRNKFEHVPHVIKWVNYLGSNLSKCITFINEEYNYDILEGNNELIEKREQKNEKLKWQIDTDVFAKIVIEIDKIFTKIQKKLEEYFKNNIKALNHPYIKKLININFSVDIKNADHDII